METSLKRFTPFATMSIQAHSFVSIKSSSGAGASLLIIGD